MTKSPHLSILGAGGTAGTLNGLLTLPIDTVNLNKFTVRNESMFHVIIILSYFIYSSYFMLILRKTNFKWFSFAKSIGVFESEFNFVKSAPASIKRLAISAKFSSFTG